MGQEKPHGVVQIKEARRMYPARGADAIINLERIRVLDRTPKFSFWIAFFITQWYALNRLEAEFSMAFLGAGVTAYLAVLVLVRPACLHARHRLLKRTVNMVLASRECRSEVEDVSRFETPLSGTAAEVLRRAQKEET